LVRWAGCGRVGNRTTFFLAASRTAELPAQLHNGLRSKGSKGTCYAVGLQDLLISFPP
jgi:hypothetical protein